MVVICWGGFMNISNRLNENGQVLIKCKKFLVVDVKNQLIKKVAHGCQGGKHANLLQYLSRTGINKKTCT